MSAVIVVEIIVGIVILAGAVRYAVRDARRRREANLQEQFLPQDEREEQARGERDVAQHRSEVADRPDGLDIRPVDPAARDHYTQRWEAVQTEFVDQPGPALDEADRLVTDVMRDRGYPVEDFDEHAELVAADHPQVVEHYRAACAVRQGRHGLLGASDTEDLQQAFGHYHALFDELMHDRQATGP